MRQIPCSGGVLNGEYSITSSYYFGICISFPNTYTQLGYSLLPTRALSLYFCLWIIHDFSSLPIFQLLRLQLRAQPEASVVGTTQVASLQVRKVGGVVSLGEISGQNAADYRAAKMLRKYLFMLLICSQFPLSLPPPLLTCSIPVSFCLVALMNYAAQWQRVFWLIDWQERIGQPSNRLLKVVRSFKKQLSSPISLYLAGQDLGLVTAVTHTWKCVTVYCGPALSEQLERVLARCLTCLFHL